LSETNTAGATVTDNVPQIAFASVDSASTSSLSAANPIAVGNNSYEKYNRLKVTGVAPNSLSAFGIYFSATAPTDGGGSSTYITPKFGVNATFATPVATASSVATTACSTQTSAPGTSFTAPANTLNAYSAYTVQQLQTGASASGGNVTFPSPWTSYGYTWS
jgi:hypothetical protein